MPRVSRIRIHLGGNRIPIAPIHVAVYVFPDVPELLSVKVESIKDEFLDRMIFFGEASLQHAVTEYVVCYHQGTTHQGKDDLILLPRHDSDPPPRDGPPAMRLPRRLEPVRCRERLGGLLKFYTRRPHNGRMSFL